MIKGATFSECRRYRWSLWRFWEPRIAPAVFIGLNPSTADENVDDPTIRRCIGFAKAWGKGGLVMLNAYGYRATDPREMAAAADPIGPDNDSTLAHAGATVDDGGIVIAAWGAHCDPEREANICRIIGHRICCLGKTKSGRPRHPLYLRSDTRPELFFEP